METQQEFTEYSLKNIWKSCTFILLIKVQASKKMSKFKRRENREKNVVSDTKSYYLWSANKVLKLK